MNVVIYDLTKNLERLTKKLEQINNISIFFALDEDELIEMALKFKPECIFINKNKINSVYDNFQHDGAKLHIYMVNESSSKLELTDYQNNKRVDFENTIVKPFVEL